MDFHLTHHRRISRKGQLTLIDLAMAPIVAILLSVLVVYFLNSAISANLVTAVDQAPITEGCNFALTSLYGDYYVHTASSLNTLRLYYPSQYLASEASKAQSLSASCGRSCTLSSTFSQNSLSNSTSLYSDMINYYSSFSLSVLSESFHVSISYGKAVVNESYTYLHKSTYIIVCCQVPCNAYAVF